MRREPSHNTRYAAMTVVRQLVTERGGPYARASSQTADLGGCMVKANRRNCHA
jgi:hypothetical protein